MIIINSVRCCGCGIVMESKYRHDFVICKCANETFVDGGHDYQRIGGVDLSKIEIWNNETDLFEPLTMRTMITIDKLVEETVIEDVGGTCTDKELLDLAVTLLAKWSKAVHKNSSYDSWDSYYKDAMWNNNPLRELIDKKIEVLKNES